MATIQSSDAYARYRSAAMQPRLPPMRRAPVSLWALWALAGFLFVGLVYIATDPTPMLDVLTAAPPTIHHAG